MAASRANASGNADIPPFARPIVTEGSARSDGTKVGVLLSHGFTGSVASMRPWAEHLDSLGYAIDAPRLPGHGTSWQDMVPTTYADYYAEVEASYEQLCARVDKVVVGGLSMGAGLALWLAAQHPEISGVIAVNPALASINWQLKLVPYARHIFKSVPGVIDDIKKPGVVEHGYPRTPLKPLHSMVSAWPEVIDDLPKVTCPLLLLRSTEDHVVDPSSAEIILNSISSPSAKEILLKDSYHVATLDNDAERIFEESAKFIDRVTQAT